MGTSQFTLYRSTDTSAPVLTGAAGGELATLLDAVLVNGYGTKSAAGWTTAYTGTNKRIYKPGSGSGMLYHLLDDASFTGTSRDAEIRGCESATGIDTVTNSFPTTAQCALNAVNMRKSATADATARPWLIAADNRTVYGWVSTGDSAGLWVFWAFGDFYSLVAGDKYNAMVIGSNASKGSALGVGDTTSDILSYNLGALARHYNCRKASGAGTSEPASKTGNQSMLVGAAANYAVNGAIVYPNAADNDLWMGPIWVLDTTSATIRGRLRGLYQPFHAYTNFSNGDTFSGDPAGAMAGKTFLVQLQQLNPGAMIIETSATVESN